MAQAVGTALGSTIGDSLNNAFKQTPEQKAAKNNNQNKLDAQSNNQGKKQNQQQLLKEKRINQLKADLTQRSENAEDGHYTRNEIANRNRNQTATDNQSARSKGKEWWNSTADSSSDVGIKQKQSKSTYSFWGEVAKSMERKQAFAKGKFASLAKYSQVDIDELPLDQQVSYYEGFHSTLGDYVAAAEVMMARAVAINGVGGALKSAATYGMKKFGFFNTADDNLSLIRYNKVVSGVSKSEIKSLLQSGDFNLPAEQTSKVLKLLGSGRMDKVTLKLMENGNVRLSAERSGRSSGYQRMSFEIDSLGKTNKVVQTAFDDINKLVHQRPGEPKNNLYDVKKWNTLTY